MSACGFLTNKSTLSFKKDMNHTLAFTWYGKDTKNLGDIGLGFVTGKDFSTNAKCLSDTFSKIPVDLVITCKASSKTIQTPKQDFTCTNNLNSNSKTIVIPTDSVLSLGQTSKIDKKNIINISLTSLEYINSLNKVSGITY